MMKETMLSHSLRLMYTGTVALSIGMLAHPAFAQDSTEPVVTAVPRVEITGSNIRRVDAEGTAPLQVITADEMKKSGYTSVAEVLQNISANGQGTLSSSVGASFATGASGMALRGLNTGATLTLIDGHRMAPYPLADNAQYAFVDISNIPFDAIDRIEVLKDGASAVYGSDAIAGVVNIILKKKFSGTTVNVDGGGSQEGGAANVHASVTTGFGDLDADGYNAYVSLEVKHVNEINWESRRKDGQWASKDATATGGMSFVPGVGNAFNGFTPTTSGPYFIPPSANGNPAAAVFPAGSTCTAALLASAAGCPWNQHQQLTPEVQNVNLLGSFTKRLSDGWELNVKASLFDAKTDYVNAPTSLAGSQYYTPGVNGGVILNSKTPLGSVGGPAFFANTVPAGYPGNTTGAPALVYGTIDGAPNTGSQVDSKAIRLVGDLDGTIGEWDIKTSLGYTRTNAAQTTYGALDIPAFHTAVNRTANPFNISSGSHSSADMSAIFPDMYANSVSTLEFGEVHATRSLMALPGGDLGFSTGLAFVHREIEQVAPNLVAEGTITGNPAFASGEQNDASAYAELVVPVLKSLELDFDERFDQIDTTGNAVTGKAAFKWSPVNSFALRGSASTGFRAPNINESGNAGTIGYFTSGYVPYLCPGGPTASNGNPAAGAVTNFNGTNYCATTPPVLGTSNAALKPERSRSFTLGAVFEPIKGWSTTADLYKITIADQIAIPQPNYITGQTVRSTIPVPGSAAGCADGNGGTVTCTQPFYPLVWYPQPFVNLNQTTVEGFEIGSRYKFGLGDFGSLKTEIDWTHTMSYKLESDGVTYQLVGTHGPSAVSNDTGNPADKADLTFSWDKGPLDISANFDWIGRYSITDPSVPGGAQLTCAGAAFSWYLGNNPPSNYCHVASFLNTNLSAHYQLTKQWTIYGSIGNVFNKQPPVDLETYGNNGISTNMSFYNAGVVGRSFHAGTSYSF